MTYLDSSAIVKRFVLEKGTPYVRHLFTQHQPIGTSTVAYVEVHSALARLRRQSLLSASQYDSLSGNFDVEFDRCHVINLTDEVAGIARRLAGKHSLRALDLIHLASAVHLYEHFGSHLSFAGADRELLRAAAEEGIQIVDVEVVMIPRGNASAPAR
jgi:predicted nucleic acid-binding protein